MVRVFEVYYHDTNLMGYEIDHKPAYLVMKDYPVKFDLRGKEAHFVVVSNDLGLTRDDAIAFASAVHSGKFRMRRVDLTLCNP